MDGMYYFKKVDDYFLNLDDDSVIYTDKIFEGMYSTHFIEPNKFSLERYDMNKLNSQGAVSYIGLRPYSTYADQNEIKIRILIPLHLRNQNLSLKIVLRSNYLTKYQNCKNVVGKYPEGRALDNGRYQNAIFEASIPKEEQDKGFLNFSLFLPGDFPQVDYRLDTETKGGNCGFYFDGITLESVF